MVAAPMPRAPVTSATRPGSGASPVPPHGDLRNELSLPAGRSAPRPPRHRRRRVAQHSCRADRAHPRLAQQRQQLGHRARVAGRGGVHAGRATARAPASARSRYVRRAHRRRLWREELDIVSFGTQAGRRRASRTRGCRRVPRPSATASKVLVAERTSSTTTSSSASWPIDSVPAKPSCSPLEP